MFLDLYAYYDFKLYRIRSFNRTMLAFKLSNDWTGKRFSHTADEFPVIFQLR